MKKCEEKKRQSKWKECRPDKNKKMAWTESIEWWIQNNGGERNGC